MPKAESRNRVQCKDAKKRMQKFNPGDLERVWLREFHRFCRPGQAFFISRRPIKPFHPHTTKKEAGLWVRPLLVTRFKRRHSGAQKGGAAILGVAVQATPRAKPLCQ